MLVILVLIAVVALFLLMAVPRGREQARLAACQMNLAQIGQALALYDQANRSLPAVGRPGPPGGREEEREPGPLRVLLESLGVQDFRGLTPGGPVPAATSPLPGDAHVPGIVCSADPNATSGVHRGPVSYRALTGSDERGRDGPFAPGRRVSLSQVEEADGTSFTAGCSERLVGDARNAPSDVNYAVVAGPLPSDACTMIFLRDQQASWRGNAGSSWRAADYVSTLYNHGMRPGGRPSCLAGDGASAFQGASSGHARGVNLLMLDGAVKLVAPGIDSKVWKAYADVGAAGGDPAHP
jgi:hypothetical protein